MKDINLKTLTEEVKALAKDAGSFIREERKHFQRSKVVAKQSHDYVSYVDKTSEKRIVEKLRKLLPEAGFITEEGSADFNNENYCWVVDPLDGTTNFIHDIAPYCVSIALRSKEELLMGVVYEICRDECFWTYKGAPSYLNDTEIHVTDIADYDAALIELGFPYNAIAYKPIAENLVHEFYGKVAGVRLLGAAATELCYVAAGRCEARIEAFLGPWDIAAGTLILQNAGGKVTDFSGTDQYESGRQVLASNGKLHQYLLDVLAKSQEQKAL